MELSCSSFPQCIASGWTNLSWINRNQLNQISYIPLWPGVFQFSILWNVPIIDSVWTYWCFWPFPIPFLSSCYSTIQSFCRVPISVSTVCSRNDLFHHLPVLQFSLLLLIYFAFIILKFCLYCWILHWNHLCLANVSWVVFLTVVVLIICWFISLYRLSFLFPRIFTFTLILFVCFFSLISVLVLLFCFY